MSARNTLQSYGVVARLFHWLTAFLILAAIPLGIIANQLPYDTAEALAQKATLFSIHKTIGIAAFFVALGRILWALVEDHPAPLHPQRRLELWLARLVHWMLYISLVVVPLTGWVHHAAVTGFAPIWWPFGQGLPFVPQSEAVAQAAGAAHWIFTKLLLLAILLHIAGALKHHVIDRDSTLRRMTRGIRAPERPEVPGGAAIPMVAAITVFGLAAGVVAMPRSEPAPTTAPVVAPTVAEAPAAAGNWQVSEGTLGIAVRQMGQEVQGSFADWTAEITFDETPAEGRHGHVTVRIATGSLTLGSVSDQAKGKDFFDVTTFPEAIFTADILPAAAGAPPGSYLAEGTLDLRGVTVPVSLPFMLAIAGDTATMTGEAALDRRDYAMGASYGDESTVGFGVAARIALTAQRLR